jgi:hypothetical protein
MPLIALAAPPGNQRPIPAAKFVSRLSTSSVQIRTAGYCERLIGHDGADANADEPTDQGGADSSQQHDGDVCAV